MPTKWDRFQSGLDRIHEDLFGDTRYIAEFFNYSAGAWDPDNDEMTGETKTSIGTANVEIVPPAQDSTIEVESGTDVDWSTSIRLPNRGSGSLTVESGTTYTIDIGELETYELVTVEANATLTVDGKLITSEFVNNGTVNGGGEVSALSGDANVTLVNRLQPLGVDNERPTEVELIDQKDGSDETFELHSYTTEIGSGMIMCRLVD